MPRKTLYFETSIYDRTRHVVVGHSQIRELWNLKSLDTHLKFPIDWISVSGGRVTELVEIIKREVKYSEHDEVKVTGIIWQNSITSLSIPEVERIITDLEKFMIRYTHAKLALPEVLYVPGLYKHFDKIREINELLRNYQQRNCMNFFPLSKVATRSKQGVREIRPILWKEFLEGTGPGYHLSHKGRLLYVKFIRNFHAYGFSGKGKVSLL